MADYLITLIFMSSTVGIVSYISYPGASEKAVKFASSLLIIYTVLMPALSFIGKVSDMDFKDYFGNISDGEYNPEGNAYIEVSEKAFEEGIYRLLKSEYGIEQEEAAVYIFDFDFEKMRAGKIKIFLSGKSALKSWREIEERISEFCIGECEVKIEIGG